MAEADEVFERARAAFRQASEAGTIVSMRMHAELGMALLDRADALSGIVEIHPKRPERLSHK
jgi:hypothetical protein